MQHHRRISYPGLLEGREQRDADIGFIGGHVAQLGLHPGQCLARFLAVELVGLGEQHQQLDRAVAHARRHEPEQLPVELGEAEARIDEQHHAGQAAPHLEIVGHHLLPAQLRAARHRRIAIAGQVGEQRVGAGLGAELEEVDVLGAPRRLRRERKALLLREHVDRGGFARVGAAHERDLGQLGGRQLRQLARGGEEARGVGPGERDLFVTRLGRGIGAWCAGRSRRRISVGHEAAQSRHCKILGFCT